MEGSQVASVTKINFDPEAYLEICFERFTGLRQDDAYVSFVLDALHEIFETGEITGERLLDIGSGPVVHQVYAASKWFREIVLSDLWEENLEILRDWKQGRRVQEKSVFKYMIGLEEKSLRDDWKAAQQDLARKVRAIVRFDMRDTKLLSGTEAEGLTFDAINVTLVHIGASSSIAECRKTVLNYSHLLKQDGHLIVIDPIGSSYYEVGNKSYFNLSTNKEEMQAMFRSCGYDIVLWKQPDTLRLSRSDVKSFFAMVAKKRTTV